MDTFRRRWFKANALAFLGGHIVYTPLAHGFTGSHGRDLSLSQLTAHSLALALVGVLVASAQRWSLAPQVEVPRWRVGLTAVAYPVAFWIGYYQPWINGPDTDMLLGYLVLGAATWFLLPPLNRRMGRSVLAALAFPVAGLIGEILLILSVVALGWTPDMQHLGTEILFWVTVGGTAGVLGGFLSGRALAPMLNSESTG